MVTRVIRRTPVSNESPGLTGLPPVLQRVYANRGVSDPAELEMSIQHIIPPEQLLGIDQAAELLFNKIANQETIIVVGDYDADGATSTALAIRGLQSVGASDVHYFVPNRFEFGYGLTPEIVDHCSNLAPGLIITVDNGISSIEGIDHARRMGIDVLVTDHHLPADQLPDATVIVNPNQPGDSFPSKALAGVGVMFYVLIALRSRMRNKQWFAQHNAREPNFAELLDLVALGTVADVVPLDRNNRILVEQGLRRIRAGQCCPGIRALLNVAGCDYKRAIASDLAFYVGPRINAAGRLQDMSAGIECLLTIEEDIVTELAASLHALNAERRQIENRMRDEAIKGLNSLLEDKSISAQRHAHGICIFQPEWHQGVIGILAARIKEKYYRPTIAFAESDDGELKGSARSIPGVHIRDVLDTIAAKHPGLISKFGGHAMAAGLSLPKNNYQEFTQAFEQVLSAWMSPEDLHAEILSDGELKKDELDLATAKVLRNSGPWGQGFPSPVFDGEFTVLDYRVVGEHHLKLVLQPQNSNISIDAIAFNYANYNWNNRATVVHAAYQLDVNYFQGIESPQLLIQHLEVRDTH